MHMEEKKESLFGILMSIMHVCQINDIKMVNFKIRLRIGGVRILERKIDRERGRKKEREREGGG